MYGRQSRIFQIDNDWAKEMIKTEKVLFQLIEGEIEIIYLNRRYLISMMSPTSFKRSI